MTSFVIFSASATDVVFVVVEVVDLVVSLFDVVTIVDSVSSAITIDDYMVVVVVPVILSMSFTTM